MKSIDRTLKIDNDSCIRCGKCARVCPSGIMIQEEVTKEIRLDHTDTCINCGHCVDVCPSESVLHSSFPKNKVHMIDYAQMPTPEQVMLLIKSRRSNRAITPTPVPAEMLDQIIEAARYAPTASNKQQVSYTVITDPEQIRQITDFTIGVFSSIAKKLLNPVVQTILKPFFKEVYALVPAFTRLKKEHEAGNDPIGRKATALILFHTPRNHRFGCEDANLAYQNASLMAQSLGISQIYMGFVIQAIKQGNKKEFLQRLGIQGDVQAIMALGVPAFKYAKYTDR